MDGDIRIGVYNFLVVTLMAIIGIALAKMVFGKYRVPGLSDVVATA